MISVVGQTFLGLTINCARCHAHKFDPIPQEEYYRVKSVFEGVKHGERSIANPAEAKAREEHIAALKKEIAAAQDVVARIEDEGFKRAAEKQSRTRETTQHGPTPFARWTFDHATNAVMPGELKGGATITNGALRLGDTGAFYQTRPLPRDIREKTLEAWVVLADLKQGGGAAISVENEDGRVFDAIVFGEREPKKWMAGSSGFERTRDLEAPEETSLPGARIHLAVVYGLHFIGVQLCAQRQPQQGENAAPGLRHSRVRCRFFCSKSSIARERMLACESAADSFEFALEHR